MAMWELAPGSPWNAIFSCLVMVPCINGLGFSQYLAGGFEIGGGIDPARAGVDDGDIDPPAGPQRPELLQFFLAFERGGRQSHKTLERRAAISVEANVMIARPVAPRRGGAR